MGRDHDALSTGACGTTRSKGSSSSKIESVVFALIDTPLSLKDGHRSRRFLAPARGEGVPNRRIPLRARVNKKQREPPALTRSVRVRRLLAALERLVFLEHDPAPFDDRVAQEAQLLQGLLVHVRVVGDRVQAAQRVAELLEALEEASHLRTKPFSSIGSIRTDWCGVRTSVPIWEITSASVKPLTVSLWYILGLPLLFGLSSSDSSSAPLVSDSFLIFFVGDVETS